MANIFPAFVKVEPSYTIPEPILPYTQASGAFGALYGGAPQVRIGTGDMLVYGKRLSIRTKVATGQSAYNALPSCTVQADQFSTPTYLIRTRAEYDHHDTTAAGAWNVSLPKAQQMGMRQATFQFLRNMLLYGVQPANGEGLLNAPGITQVNLPADTFGDTGVTTYDNGQMGTFLLTQVLALKVRCNQMGRPSRIVLVGPQRVLGQFELPGIVQLTSVQRPGGGSFTTMEMVKWAMEENGDKLLWAYDDTLIGQGNGGTDAVLIVAPELLVPKEDSIDTNAFASFMPGLNATTLMLCDMAAPREITTPLPGGAVDVLSEMRSTPGWGIRPEAVTVASMQYP